MPKASPKTSEALASQAAGSGRVAVQFVRWKLALISLNLEPMVGIDCSLKPNKDTTMVPAMTASRAPGIFNEILRQRTMIAKVATATTKQPDLI